jgi:hypothetical protein
MAVALDIACASMLMECIEQMDVAVVLRTPNIPQSRVAVENVNTVQFESLSLFLFKK